MRRPTGLPVGRRIRWVALRADASVVRFHCLEIGSEASAWLREQRLVSPRPAGPLTASHIDGRAVHRRRDPARWLYQRPVRSGRPSGASTFWASRPDRTRSAADHEHDPVRGLYRHPSALPPARLRLVDQGVRVIRKMAVGRRLRTSQRKAEGRSSELSARVLAQTIKTSANSLARPRNPLAPLRIRRATSWGPA
jgi:hypothetical protein